MGRKERNVLARIERQSNTLPPAKSLASRREFRELSRLSMEWNSVPGEWKTEIIEHDSPPLSEEEQNALDDILSSCDGGVYFNPRKRKKYIVNSSDLKKWQVMGFEDYVSFCGYLSTNGLNNLVKDFDAVYADKEE
ncbi:TPA: hypothetical protein L7J54_003924 [Klebsiella pneumoniae]|uniref:hypothetical protein n=1 Tax=Klebsiella TaxID=570 RepID=UPI00028309F4|nr:MULTISPECIES: hypothetical protein [Klebsiella]EIY5142740.1 hypothetical protein [Klebsiella variicola]EKB68603.1 hypothetical protein HMPREF1305_00893 [Klebsiella pneumoniae subsp. pneumoniae WGLW1]EKB80647.1 hypothetical protein HMPREF1307_01067 [Klebsiella pneumoniae subsp. pneumoniae WGLW3]EKU0190748.1 hypothetical protein [Klebsiella pneumoniae]EKV7302027.1 hypothetical protein [Klebsiella pneumoniae]